ncbi:rho GTPase-activating protein 10-like isoform X1 [Conger conger]|uniref:rho GTPase-activating protein 10-like isoform X1 n=1 Tax=Conger conger TaxID=82655 RepID=UPI002A59F0B6|nr:rho GTPase-activating protein 10-like isoform X1 [Conger conger]
MGLHPLEFSECYLDSPSFREKIKEHEAELDKTSRFIKELHKDAKNLINATKQLGMAQRKFAQSLGQFQFEYIGDARTDDEKCIDESLQEFASFLRNLEDQRELMMRNITGALLKPLEQFRKEQLGSAKLERKKYEKETEKYYSSLEKLLTLSAKKKDQQLQEADQQVEGMRQHFQEQSLEYVCRLQEIQERKKFECVEPMLAFFQTVFTFYHQGFELAKDFDHYKTALQINIQNTRSRFEATRSEVEDLMRKIQECPQEHIQTSQLSIEGYLFVQEKRPPPFGSSWVKRYCTYIKEQKLLNMMTFDHRSGGKIGEIESVTLKSCLWKNNDVFDRRFCLDIETTDRPGLVLTVQALSEDDRKFWTQAMGGKDPMRCIRTYSKQRGIDAELDEVGFSFVNNCVNAIEKRGICDQGLYRVVGVSSKVQRLLSMMIEEKTGDEVDLSVTDDWDIKTITSALKLYLRSLPEPLMTYGLYKEFIVPAKCGSPESRLEAIHYLVHQLPEKNRDLLGIMMQHLSNVAANSNQNLMTVANLGVVFGPTLMRPQEETVAAIMDLKFQNIVVEILIEQHEKIFDNPPSMSPSEEDSSLSAPARQSKTRQSRQKRPLAVYNPQVLDIQAGTTPAPATNAAVTNAAVTNAGVTNAAVTNAAVTDEASLGSTDSVSSQSSANTASTSGSPLEEAQKHLNSNGGTPVDSVGARTSMVSWELKMEPGITIAETVASPVTTPNELQGESVTSRKAKAVYPCEAEHDTELSFQIGAIFHGVIYSREPGWLEGELEGKRGLIPENYVELL